MATRGEIRSPYLSSLVSPLKSWYQGRTDTSRWEQKNKEPGRMTNLQCAVDMRQQRSGRDGTNDKTRGEAFKVPLNRYGPRLEEVPLLKEDEGRSLVMEAPLMVSPLKSWYQRRTDTSRWEQKNKEPGRMTNLQCAVDMRQQRSGRDGTNDKTERTKLPPMAIRYQFQPSLCYESASVFDLEDRPVHEITIWQEKVLLKKEKRRSPVMEARSMPFVQESSCLEDVHGTSIVQDTDSMCDSTTRHFGGYEQRITIHNQVERNHLRDQPESLWTKPADSRSKQDAKNTKRYENVIVVTESDMQTTSNGRQTVRVHIHVGDHRLATEEFRKQHGINNTTDVRSLSLSDSTSGREEIKLSTRLRLYGEGKDSWQHCRTSDGEFALPETQNVHFSCRGLRSSAFPKSLHWLLENSSKCSTSSQLQAEVTIQASDVVETLPLSTDSETDTEAAVFFLEV